ncbi:MAG: putative bifunctional diguanylate cyclase/phosphodiesterase [Pseudomonadales bacterium]
MVFAYFPVTQKERPLFLFSDMPIDDQTQARLKALTSDSNGLRVEAASEQTRLLFTQGQVGQMVTVGVACAIALVFWQQVPSARLAAWFCPLLLLSGWRAVLIARFRRCNPPDADLTRWRRQFLVGAVGTATLLSAAWWVLAPLGGFEQHVLLAFIFGGMSLGAVSVLGAALSIYVVYIALLCLPGMLWMLLQGSSTYTLMAGLTLIFFSAMVFTGRGHHRTLMRIMILSSANQALSEQQERLRDFAEMGADLFWESDAQGCFKYLSEGYKTLTGVASKKMLGQPIGHAGGPALLPEHHLQITDANGVHLPLHDHTIDWELPDGRAAVLLSNALPIVDRETGFRGFRGTVRDITEQHRLAEKLKHQATHDDLTELGNRREFERRLSTMLLGAQKGGATHAVCYVDLDQFKVVNDTCGHAAGDALLRRIAGELLQRLRSRDTLARLGGDEFGILLEHCSAADALALAHEVRNTIAAIRFQWEESVFNVTASIGLVAIDANSADLAGVMMAADTACFAAKDAGRNRVHAFEVDDQTLSRQHGEMQWVTRINEALDHNRFVLVAQPVLSLVEQSEKSDREHARFELLVRMRDTDDTLILPGAFLPAAERYNLATRVDRWVVDAAFHALLVPDSQLDAVEMCSINLSGHSLSDEDFVDYLSQRFREQALPAHKICFEITETAAMTNLNAAIGFMERLRRFGCRFALDDFGTGLSSFGYLRNLPVDYIKIDGVFVRDMVDDKIDFAMVKSIHEMGRVMGKQTVAEYVESVEILELLRDIGVDYAQGFSVGKPQPMAAYGIGGKLVELDAMADSA